MNKRTCKLKKMSLSAGILFLSCLLILNKLNQEI
nr:MAG TPA: hypothetical protein [Caudoviricetes sp.]